MPPPLSWVPPRRAQVLRVSGLQKRRRACWWRTPAMSKQVDSISCCRSGVPYLTCHECGIIYHYNSHGIPPRRQCTRVTYLVWTDLKLRKPKRRGSRLGSLFRHAAVAYTEQSGWCSGADAALHADVQLRIGPIRRLQNCFTRL